MSNKTEPKEQVVEELRKAYDTVLRCRDIDVGLFSTRFNLSLVVQGAVLAFAAGPLLGVAVGSSWSEKAVPIIIAAFGLVLAVGGRRLVRGASFWVGYWEWRLGKLELGVHPTVPIFSNHPGSHNRAMLSQLPDHLTYVSTRRSVLWLCDVFVVLWLLVGFFVALR